MRKFCTKHATWVGCAAAAITFIALHILVPAFVAGTVANRAAAGNHATSVIFKGDGVTVHRIQVSNVLAYTVCVVAIADGRMAKTVDVECL